MASLRSPRTRPRRSAVAVLALVALVLGATACNPGRPPAATVGDTDISSARVDEILAAYVTADAEAYGEQLRGDGEGTLPMAQVSSLLGNLILQTLQSELAAERGAVPTEEERTEAEASVRTSFVTQGQADPAAAEGEPSPSETASAAVFDALPTDTREWLIDLRADSLALTRVLGEAAPPDEEAARRVYDENPGQFESVCLRLLVVPADGIDAAQARLEGGEDFGEVSTDISVDPAVAEAGGSAGPCTPLTQLQQQLQPEAFGEIAGAPVGGVVGPFNYDDQGNVVLVEVQDRQVPPFEDVRDALLQQLPDGGEAALDALIGEQLAEAEVRVDPRFGRWDPETATVVPPPGPRPATTEPVAPEADLEAPAPAG